MTAKTRRILKEARPLFWPWCAVAMAGALPIVHPLHSIAWISLLGFFLGVPLLASLPLGNEFQHRTLSLLLSQPVGRMEIWGEKLGVTTVAVLSAVLVFSISFRPLSLQAKTLAFPIIGAWVIATLISATFWPLITRSTLGGVVLNIAVFPFIYAPAAAWALQRGGPFGSPSAIRTFAATVTFAFLCYAGVMLWLGRRTLARFQVTGGMAGYDQLTAGPDVMPGAWAGWMRCRPTGAILNLIRKELRLLRPVWLISLLAALGWACLSLFSSLYERGYSRNFETAVVIVSVISTLMIAIFAGSMSLGEERTSGTHAWHLILPVSAFLQWCIKLFMALFAGFVGAGILPMLIAGRLFGSPHYLVDVHLGTGWLLIVLLLTFAAFWCACAVNGTVRAVLWVVPVLIAIGLANVFGERAGRELVHVFVARFDPFASFRFAITVSRLGSNSFFRLIDAASENMTGSIQAGRLATATILVPTLLLAVIQSYRLFRTQLQDRTLSVVRRLLPLAMMAFLCSFFLLASYTFVNYATGSTRMVFFGTNYTIGKILGRRAIEKTLPSASNPDGTEALQLTVDDVAKTFPFPLPENTRRWLRNARITVTPDKAHPGGFYCEKTQWKWPVCYYSATIHLADGTDLYQSYEPDARRKFGVHFTVRAHWPGAAGEESLWDR